MELKDVKTGDTLLVSNRRSLISRLIIREMKKWGKKKYPEYAGEKVWSHAGTFVWIEGSLYVFESVDNGYKPRLFARHYNWYSSDMAVMRRNTELTKDEEVRLTHFCLHLVTISLSYQFWNFIQWLVLINTGKNWFPKREDNDKHEYCYESAMECRKFLNPDNYGNVDQTDIYQLLHDTNYKLIYTSFNE